MKRDLEGSNAMEPLRKPADGGPLGPRPPQPPHRERAVNVPPFLLVLIGVFVVVHALVVYGPQSLGTTLFLNLAFFPARLIASDIVVAQFFSGPSWLSYGTFATYGLLHGDWMHLGVNALWLVTFGAPVVRRLGPNRFLILLIAGTVAGAATHLLVFWGSAAPLVGASAGISAVMGGAARFVFDPRDQGMFHAVRHPELVRGRPIQPLKDVWSNPTVLMFCGMLLASNLLFGAVSIPGVDESSSVAWQAHIGGFALGFFGFPLIDRTRSIRSV